jgi:hypothetical protein
MDVNGIGALSAYAYQTTLNQTGSSSQALSQAMTVGQAQAAETSGLLASVGPVDPLAALGGGTTGPGLAGLAYASSAASGHGPDAIQAVLAALGGGSSALFTGSDSLPVSAAALSPSTTQALVRYAYDQSQNPDKALQQAQLGTGLNFLA